MSGLRLAAASLLLTVSACAEGVVPLALSRPPPSPSDGGTPSDGGPASADAGRAPADAGAGVADATPPDTGEPTTDAGRPTLTDDCRPGTWCWEKPFPSGEPALVARVFPGDRAVYLTESGTLATWDGQAWSLRILELPGTPVGLWAQDLSTLYVTCTGPRRGEGRALLRVTVERVELLAQGAEGSVGELVGEREDDLYALGGRVLLHWDGQSWRELPGPGNDVLLASALSTPDGLLVLESWGSGSGFGRLHRYQAGSWSLVFDFAALGQRMEGPLVSADGALWLRAFDFNRGRISVARGEAGAWAIVEAPSRQDGTLRQAGDRLWFVAASRAWVRTRERWAAAPGFPGTQYDVMAGDGETAWVFGGQVASRTREEPWRTWSSGLVPTHGFWRTADAASALLSSSPLALWTLDTPDARTWSAEALEVDSNVLAYDSGPRGAGVVAIERGLLFVEGRRVQTLIPYPPGLRAFGFVHRDETRTWVGLDDGRLIAWGGGWSIPRDLPRVAAVPAQQPQLTALHSEASGTVYVGTRLITGNKEVFEDVWVSELGGWRSVASRRGEFGRDVATIVDSDAQGTLWVAMGDVWRIEGGARMLIGRDLDLVDLAVEDDGTVSGTDGARVYRWTPSGAPLWQAEVPLPALYFTRVHTATDGKVRLTTTQGQVIRYTP